MNELTLLFAGDFCAQGRNEEWVREGDVSHLFGRLREVTLSCDLAVIDLEAPLITAGTVRPKSGPHLKADPRSAAILRQAGFGVAALANNHIMDFEFDGLSATMDCCRAAGLETVGAGVNLEDARRPYSCQIKGSKVAILNFAENEWSNTSGKEPGANPVNPVTNYRDIQNAKSAHDTVVVIYHGGHEHYPLPSPRIKQLLRFYVEAGATAVISHHTHIVSGYEVYRGAPIFYGLGNCLFDWPGKRNSPWNIGLAVQLRIGATVTFELHPFRQSDGQPGLELLTGEDRKSWENELNRLCSIIADDDQLEHHFDQFCRGKSFIYDIYLQPYSQRILASLRKRKWIPSVFSASKRRLYRNIIRCESHRDVLLHYLRD